LFLHAVQLVIKLFIHYLHAKLQLEQEDNSILKYYETGQLLTQLILLASR
jgi:hypothetical protein